MNLPADSMSRLVLDGITAAELMTPNLVSIDENATIEEAVAFLTDKGISAAPVIDEAGHPIGVLSRADIIVHDRAKLQHQDADPAFPQRVDPNHVRDIMTPVVFSVSPEYPAAKVVEEMLALRVHRLFVVDHDDVLVGVISAFDILRHMHPDQPVEFAEAAGI